MVMDTHVMDTLSAILRSIIQGGWHVVHIYLLLKGYNTLSWGRYNRLAQFHGHNNMSRDKLDFMPMPWCDGHDLSDEVQWYSHTISFDSLHFGKYDK